jgi:hypothetical protein
MLAMSGTVRLSKEAVEYVNSSNRSPQQQAKKQQRRDVEGSMMGMVKNFHMMLNPCRWRIVGDIFASFVNKATQTKLYITSWRHVIR